MGNAIVGLLFIFTIVFGFYAAIWGPDVDKWEHIDDRCALNIYHDHRLFESDKPEVRTIYCKESL